MGNARETPPWWLPANWPAPARVRAGITTRQGGSSQPPCQGFNLALHVGDDPGTVSRHRNELRRALQLSREPFWLQQIHGNHVIPASDQISPAADGSHCSSHGSICAVLVADCVPLLLTDRAGTQVAAIHAGWRGIAAGIIDSALAIMDAPRKEILAWVGPCVGPNHYEVGAEVRSACLLAEPGADTCFHATTPDHWRADLRRLVQISLQQRGVAAIYGNGDCVADNANLFYSHRRDGRTGRMAALIWIDKDQS